ncbi:MAG: signal recognition particle-docking protein FtsY [Ignavibacteriales bacterium]|nr:MAG: signal recognition particle-docking protein FtsY [Ignavibacteriales bacterium]
MSIFNSAFSKLKSGLDKTRKKIVVAINEAVTGKAVVDEDTLDRIEEILITSDIGFDTATGIIDKARERLKKEKDRSIHDFIESVKSELAGILIPENVNQNNQTLKYQPRPYVILIVGVNGAGKTTTVGKLAYNFKNEGLKVIIGAADTFRAAANEQLLIWAERAGVEIVNKEQGADPSSVTFETIQRAIKESYDIVLIDTAGRLHTKSNLMEELNKINRVLTRALPTAPNETLLVIDGNTGQNAITQSEEFAKATGITGLIITKLDGTAKGGVIFQISKNKKVPVKYVGVGEGIDDLQKFDGKLFVDALFNGAKE